MKGFFCLSQLLIRCVRASGLVDAALHMLQAGKVINVLGPELREEHSGPRLTSPSFCIARGLGPEAGMASA